MSSWSMSAEIPPTSSDKDIITGVGSDMINSIRDNAKELVTNNVMKISTLFLVSIGIFKLMAWVMIRSKL